MQLCGLSRRWSVLFAFSLAAGFSADSPSTFSPCRSFMLLAPAFFAPLFSVLTHLIFFKHYFDLVTFKIHFNNFRRKLQLLGLTFKMLQKSSLVLFSHQFPLYFCVFPLNKECHHFWCRNWGCPFCGFFYFSFPLPHLCVLHVPTVCLSFKNLAPMWRLC